MDTPKYIKLAGTGKFSHSSASFESAFILLRNPWWIGILAEGKSASSALDAFISHSGTWRLSGTLSDGRNIEAKSLIHTGIPQGPYNFEFSALTEVFLGIKLKGPPTHSTFPLVGYFDAPFSLSHRKWLINSEAIDEIKNAKDLAMRWRLPTEGILLELVCPGAQIKEHLEIAKSIMTLTSLASGTGVSSHRHIFGWGSHDLEIWRQMTGDERGPGPIVPSFEMSSFLQMALDHFDALTPEKRSALRLAINYINLSANGYLDTRLFHITQPWEFLAMAWIKAGKLSPAALSLRSRLKRTLMHWRQEHNTLDPNGFLTSRVLAGFTWPKLKDQIEQLAQMFGLDLQRLGLDIGILKTARDDVAHSGKLPEKLSGSSKDGLELLILSQRCLQLLLLRILGYKGKVYKPKEGLRSIVSMEEALRGENQTAT
jgi:hypothetical protein